MGVNKDKGSILALGAELGFSTATPPTKMVYGSMHADTAISEGSATTYIFVRDFEIT